MREILEQLIKQAGERLQELQKKSDYLRESVKDAEKFYARTAGLIACKSNNTTKVHDHAVNTESVRSRNEALGKVRLDIAAQQNYVITLTNQYLELLKAEKENGFYASVQPERQSSSSRLFPGSK